MMQLETERLILRPWSEEDAEDLYFYAKDDRVGPAAGWQPHTSVENSREIIRTVLSAPESYAMVLKSTGRPVGCAGIMMAPQGNRDMGEGEAEIGYWIGVPYWGQGLTPEAVRRLIERCFEELNCTALWCAYFDGYEKSRRAMEKCGFRYHHTVEDCPTLLGDSRVEHVCRLAKEEWQETARPVS